MKLNQQDTCWTYQFLTKEYENVFSRNPNHHNLFSYKCVNKSVIFRNPFLIPRLSAVLGPYSAADKQASNPKIKNNLKKSWGWAVSFQ